ncbi:MAG: hypothetical protein HQL37_14255 [Alphaproteobacteria bacterium]|nr:hypothetical protein [Alphaproteobacteria bacterium]
MLTGILRGMMASLMVMAVAVAPAIAQQPPSLTARAKPAANVDGFRSAKFGMDESAVRKAIVADFGLKDDKVHRDVHPTEKTTVVTIAVEGLLPDTGPAVVTYILGFHAQKLTQINVLWPQANATNLAGAAMTLRNHFLGQEFRPDSVVANAQLADGGLLAFRGIDQKGRMVIVHLQSTQAHDDPKDKGAKPDSAKAPEGYLRLSYIETPDKPDVFTLQPGQF